MLNYELIHTVNNAQRRLKRDYYNHPWNTGTPATREVDRLTVFTHGEAARQQSQDNLDFCLQVARKHDMNVVVFKDCQIQMAGGRSVDSRCAAAVYRLFPHSWLSAYEAWLDTQHPQRAMTQDSDEGESLEFYSYRHCFSVPEHQGVYDVGTGRRITNRRDIIERFWTLGFATSRGRPPSIARIRWTGSKSELKEITELADRHWDRRYASEAAKKLVTPFRSINRYAAWPGAW